MLIAMLIMCVFTFIFRDELFLGFAEASAWVSSMGRLAPLLYIAVFSLSIPLFMPTLPCLLAAGMLFGMWPGVLYAFIGNTLGAFAAFMLSRSRIRRAVRKLIRRNDVLDALDTAIEREGGKTAVLLRMSPILPGPILNYALGMTLLSKRDYFFSSIGTLPVIVAYTFVGSSFGKFAQLGSVESLSNIPPGTTVLFFGGVIATVVASMLLARRAQGLLESRPTGVSSDVTPDIEK